MGLSSFMSNGLFLIFSVTMTRFETVGLTFPPRWENSVSQNRFSPVFQQGKESRVLWLFQRTVAKADT